MTRRDVPIAIVGIGGVFPESPGPDALWSLVASRSFAAREVPEGRWIVPSSSAFDPRRGAADRVYSTRACFVEGFALDPSGLDVDPALLERLDPLFHFTLHAGRQAFLDASTGNLDRRRVGVIAGAIALPTDAFSAYARQLLDPELHRRLFGRESPALSSPVSSLNRYVAGLPAGLLAKALGLGGGCYTLDAACASSLYALKLACEELASGRADAMLTGGVSRPDSLYTQMGFSQLRALSPSGVCSPFDASADGIVVGEGAGLFLLKRLEDAEGDGDRIYGVIRGVGLSNDIDGSLLAPSGEGQLRAMRSAYAQAGWRPSDVDLVECHATGTPVGDAIEFGSLKALWEGEPAGGRCVIGSVKSNVGHLLTGAGAAGLMKTLLALREETLPPSANFNRAAPAVSLESGPFRILSRAERWEARPGRPRRAAVSSFGFGGINAHVLIEEWRPAKAPRTRAPAALPAPAAVPVAIVGMEARFGRLRSLREFQEAVLSGAAPPPEPLPADRGFGTAPRPLGHYLKDLRIPLKAFRIPPKELEEMLPQQALMLQVAGQALSDARCRERGHERTGVFIGMEIDPLTTNIHLRWALPDEAREAGGAALTANRTMGALGGIIASRIAREFRVGGPSFTLAGDDASGLYALNAGLRALQRGELDCAVVGAVDLAGDGRALAAEETSWSASGAVRPFDAAAEGAVPGEGAAAVVLKRLEDALRDGDRVYAVVRGLGAASSDGADKRLPSSEAYVRALERAYEDAGLALLDVGLIEAHGSGRPDEDRMEARALQRGLETDASRRRAPLALGSAAAVVGSAGAASGLASLVKAALALYQQILPPLPLASPLAELGPLAGALHAPRAPQYWHRNRDEGPRRAGVSSFGLDGSCVHAVLEAPESAEKTARPAERRQPLGARAEALFVIEGDNPPALIAGLSRLRAWLDGQPAGRNIEALARDWWSPDGARRGLGLSLVARSREELLELIAVAERALIEDPSSPLAYLDRVFYSPAPVGRKGRLAFVFPGSGNQYIGMGLELSAQFPEILRAADAENARLKDQFIPELFAPWRLGWGPGWEQETMARLGADHRSMIFGQVAHGVAVSDLARRFGLLPEAVIGYSLGETAGLFAMRVWNDRDEMLRRMKESTLFVSELAGPCNAARRTWNLAAHEAVDWVLGVVDRPETLVRTAVSKVEQAFLLIVNTPRECVVGGARHAVKKLVDGLGATFLPLEGVTTVHCKVAKEVEQAYRELHLLETRHPGRITFYSGAWGRPYEVSRESAADAITAQAVDGIDFSSLVNRAYDDGIRVFVEMGPRNSCSRMISKILGGRPHLAKSACVRDQSDVSTLLRLLGQLAAERVPLDLAPLYGGEAPAAGHAASSAAEGPELVMPVGLRAPLSRPFASAEGLIPPSRRPAPEIPPPGTAAAPIAPAAPQLVWPAAAGPAAPAPAAARAGAWGGLIPGLAAAEAAKAQAHARYLSLTETLSKSQLKILSFQSALAEAAALRGLRPSAAAAPPAAPTPRVPPSRGLSREQCLEFAVGSIGKVLGQAFAAVDGHPTRVRLPGEPLMLVDRVLAIEGEPRSMASGRVITEHDVLKNGWYLDGGRLPMCIAVEAGQADLFLSGFLGIDFETKGLAMYRLLDAVVTLHRSLPEAGDVVRYDIRIDRFSKQGDSWLFFFRFDSTVNGEPLITMREGCAGFFTPEHLARGQGIVLTALDLKSRPGKRPADWRELAPLSPTTLDERSVEALRRGDLAAAFGPAFEGLPLKDPMRLPGGRMKLVDRVVSLDPAGGRFGLGQIRAELDIHPDDWFLTCHFTDDMVMPGTLMYECCLHTLRIFLMRLGWVGEREGAWTEPVPGVQGRLKCRGQVLTSTKKALYEITIKELGYGPDPYAIADALMYSDGKPVVYITNLSLRLRGLTREGIEALWSKRRPSPSAADERKAALYDNASILAFAVGKPSEAFGEPYRVFDEKRVIARLPGPPYKFLDRVTAVRDAKPFELKAGGTIEAQYDVPPDAWYFKANRQASMPFAVLLEAALQPCGWFSSYMGSALQGTEDLSYRNLGGSAVQHREVFPGSGTLTTAVKSTKISLSGGMIIQNFEFSMTNRGRLVYSGDTYFGFFTKKALAEQLGVRGARRFVPSAQEASRGRPLDFPEDRPLDPEDGALTPADGLALPSRALRMFDRVELYVPDGGERGLGFLRGVKAVVPSEWFFKAHFHQDPVWPGSLGLEAFLQLLKAAARERWGVAPGLRFEPTALGRRHEWVYRGQVLPTNKHVEIEASVTEISDAERLIKADGYLMRDGLVIYQIKDFAIRAVRE